MKIDWHKFLFYGLIVAILVPLWTARAFPSQDGPFHMYAAIVVRDYNRPDRPRFREFFERSDRIVPNWVGPHLLPVLLNHFSPDMAEKIIMSIYLIGLPLSIRYALWAIRKRAAALAIVALPFVPNIYYHLGFVDFCLALPCFFLAIGYWLHHRRKLGVIHVAVLATIFLLGYFCHLVPTAMAGMFLVLLAISFGGNMQTRMRRLLPLIAAGSPTAILALAFLLAQRNQPKMNPMVYSGFSRLKELVHIQAGLATRDLLHVMLDLGLFAIVSGWLFWRRRGAKFLLGLDIFLVIAAVCGLMFLVAPDAGAGGSMLVIRLAIFPFFALLLWWGSQPIGSFAFRRLSLACTIVSATACLLTVYSMLAAYRQIDPYLQDINAAVMQIQPDSTLFFTGFPGNSTFTPDGHLVVHGPDVFANAGDRVAAERGIVIIDCQPATTSYQRITFWPGLSPGFEQLISFTAHAQRIGKPLDYVILWTGGKSPSDDASNAIRQQLRDGYDLIFTSPSTGYAMLYRRKTLAPAI